MGPKPERKDNRSDVIPGEDDNPHAGRDIPPAGSGREPHHELNNPVREPDPTEYPDPFEKRPDPRDPDKPDAAPASPSTSDPRPPRNVDRAKAQGDTAA